MQKLATVCVFVAFVGGIIALPNPHHKFGHKGQDHRGNGPKVDLLRFRFDEDKGKYIRLGATDHCPENMRFFAIQGNETAGTCDCDYYECSRPLVYSEETRKCHFAWSQGPCKFGEWYTLDANLKGVCETRACNESLSQEPVTSDNVSLFYWFLYPGDGKCYESGSQGFCKNEDEFLAIAPGEPIPKCRNTAKCTPIGRPEPQLCFAGNKRHFQQGKC